MKKMRAAGESDSYNYMIVYMQIFSSRLERFQKRTGGKKGAAQGRADGVVGGCNNKFIRAETEAKHRENKKPSISTLPPTSKLSRFRFVSFRFNLRVRSCLGF